jgi:glycerol-3-phosphate acyltransferase PlsY
MVNMNEVAWTIGIVSAYIAGSIPFGVLLAKTKGINIREHGSKNIGATNVGRVLGKKLGTVCFFFLFL